MNFKNLFNAGIAGDLIALVAGLFLTFSFAPFDIFPLAILAMLLLLSTWLYVSPRRAFRRGFLFGLGNFCSGVYWVYISIHTFGSVPIWLSAFITAGFVGILALFPAVSGYFLCRYFPKADFPKTVLAFPAYWLILEWSRSWVLTGFPWLLLGYSQMNSWLRGYAPVLGVYGVSMAVLLTSGLLLQTFLNYQQRLSKNVFYNLLLFIALWTGGALLLPIEWTHPFGKPLKISLIQGNIPQQIKWAPESIKPTLDRYISFTRDHWGSDIIVWPEGAIPVPWPAAQAITDRLGKEAITNHATIITGIPIRADLDGNFYNAIISFGVDENAYFKHHLVPFGEFTPFGRWLKKPLSFLQIPMSDFQPGTSKVQQLNVAGITISPFICYEIAFPEFVKRKIDAAILLNISDDAWFGHSIAAAQHLQIAQMRSLELNKPQLFVGNDGLTAIINQHGEIVAIAPPFVPYVLTGNVQPYLGATLWQLFGMDPVMLLIIIMLVKAMLLKRKTALKP